MKQFENIDTVIRDIAAFDRFEYDMVARAVKRAFQYLIDSELVDEGIKYFNNIKSDYVTIADNWTAKLPKDCAEVIKVGYQITDSGRSELRYLGHRRFIHRQDIKDAEIVFPACTCTTATVTTVTATTNTQLSQYEQETLGLDSLVFHNLAMRGGYGELYGYRPVMYPNGVYTVDYENNRLVLDSGTDIQSGNTLVVEYKSHLTSDSYKYIPFIAFDALRYKALEYLDTQNATTNKMFFARELQRIRSAAHEITIDDLMQVLSGGANLRFRS